MEGPVHEAMVVVWGESQLQSLRASSTEILLFGKSLCEGD
jgi:hypothetical protein